MMARASVALALLVVAASIISVATAVPQQEPNPFSISMNVDLVVLHASVRDRHGFATDLGKDNFRIYEEGQPQPIKFFQRADIPVTMGLVIDHSASMIPKREEVITATTALVQASNPLDEIFIVRFNERPSLALP